MVFYVRFNVIPTAYNAEKGIVRNAVAHCWIADFNQIRARNIAVFSVAKYEWSILDPESVPVAVTESDFVREELFLFHYKLAVERGMAILYLAEPADGKAQLGPLSLKPPVKIDLNNFISKQKQLSSKGRCLHFNSGTDCGEIINAHSIQRSGQLSHISQNGLVYVISDNMGTIAKNRGRPVLEKQGIKKVSTFCGFCGKHDNELFGLIDDGVLQPSAKQAALYAYRSLCREFFVKENSFALYSSQAEKTPPGSFMNRYFEGCKDGAMIGLANLQRHKANFDNSMAAERYDDIQYVLFSSRQKPFVAFSGLFYPEYDFKAQRLQNFHKGQELDLLTICSAPVDGGWGFLFAWHKSSSRTCQAFIDSLRELVSLDVSRAVDSMFGLTLTVCENLAISPHWWDALKVDQKEAVLSSLTNGVDIFAPTKPNYLANSLEGLCGWKFDDLSIHPHS